MHEFFRFGIVGAIGFAVDAGLLLFFVAMGVGPLIGRLLSFVTAATVTFLLNHRYTFRNADSPTVARWMLYLALTALGAFVNIGVYQLWISHQGTTPLQLLSGTALGSLVAMLVNYSFNRFVVFKPVSRAGL